MVILGSKRNIIPQTLFAEGKRIFGSAWGRSFVLDSKGESLKPAHQRGLYETSFIRDCFSFILTVN
jgi:hypothetical protein